jgi:PGF-pre-PGF domain-containing protein
VILLRYDKMKTAKFFLGLGLFLFLSLFVSSALSGNITITIDDDLEGDVSDDIGGSITPTTTSTTSPSGGGTSGTTTTTAVTTTTTTTLPPVEETKSLDSITAGETGIFEFTDPDLRITQIAVIAGNTMTSPSLTVSQSSATPAAADTSAPDSVYGYLTVSEQNITDADVTSVTIKFKVTKVWIEENNVDEDTIALYRYSNGAWTKLATTKISEDATYIYYEAVSPSLSVFAISGAQIVTTTTTVPTTTTTVPEEIEVTPVTILVIVVIVAVAIFLLWKFKIIG